MIKVWGRLIVKNKIDSQHLVEHAGDACFDTYMDCIQSICYKLDIERPVMLKKHERDIMNFGCVRFLPTDFMETVMFDKFDVDIYIDKKKPT